MAAGDYLSIFTHGLDDENGHSPNITSLTTLGYFEPDTEIESYEEWSSMPNSQYFQEETIDYNRESNLFDLLATESINLHGTNLVYYTTSYNTSRDKIFGEDNRRNVVRNFNVMAHYELPNEENMWSGMYQIEGIDNFHMTISMKHMEIASQYNSEGTRLTYPSHRPKQGDYLRSVYNSSYMYEVVTVKQQAGQFLKRQHLWDLIVRPMRDEHLNVSATISSTDSIRDFVDIEDIFSTSASVDIEKEIRLFDNSGTQTQDPLFGDWT